MDFGLLGDFTMERSHLVFFDGECGICDQAVQTILQLDKQLLFVFAPLNGETAAQFLKGLPAALTNSDSLILIENYRSKNNSTYIGSTAVFRICWLLGGWWSLDQASYFFCPLFCLTGVIVYLPVSATDFSPCNVSLDLQTKTIDSCHEVITQHLHHYSHL